MGALQGFLRVEFPRGLLMGREPAHVERYSLALGDGELGDRMEVFPSQGHAAVKDETVGTAEPTARRSRSRTG
jgi:hypothetical protein